MVLTRPGVDSGVSDRLAPDGDDGPRTKAVRMARRAPDHAARIAERLISTVGRDRFDRWIGSASEIRLSEGHLDVTVTSRSTGSLLQKRFGDVLRSAAREELGHDVQIRVHVDSKRGEAGGPETAGGTHTGDDAGGVNAVPGSGTVGSGAIAGRRLAAASEPVTRRATDRSVPGGERYRLESFVVGASNRLAYGAAVQMAEGLDDLLGQGGGAMSGGGRDGAGCRRLFVHGPCGVGKSHLLHGLAIRFKERHPGMHVRVTSGEQFVNEFLQALRAGTTGGVSGPERFRRAYRKLDLLCIDDVHFLASKQQTQQELLHTFDDLEKAGARIALVSDVHPHELGKFSPALVSRFVSGMVAGLGAPDAELRSRIIRTQAALRGLSLDERALQALLERTSALPGGPACSIRDIEGLMTRLEAVQRLWPGQGSGAAHHHAGGRSDGFAGANGAPPYEGGRITAAVVAQALETQPGGVESGGDVRPVRVDTIIQRTCEVLGVEQADLSGKTRHKRVVLARAIITHLARELTTLSYPEIARAIGRPNHSTVITAHQRLSKQIAADAPLEFAPVGEAATVGAVVRVLTQAMRSGRRAG